MSRWFRLYDDTLNDPKILKLSDKTYRIWIGILCVASKHNGALPPFEDIALMLRMKPEKLQPELEKLIESGLIDHDDDGLRPHNWEGRQYKSDVSTERVKRFRNGKRNVSETPPDTDTDTDTESKKDIGALRAPKPAIVSRGMRLPEGWTPDEEGRAYALTILSPEQLQPEIENFTDYWKAANGAKAVKRDWSATWRMWVRNSVKFSGGGNGPGRLRPLQDDSKSVSRAIDRQIGNITIGPRPRLVSDTGQDDLRLLPPGRSTGP